MGEASLVVDLVLVARDAADGLPALLARIPARELRSIVVVDNGSRDATGLVARDAGCVVVREPDGGHGAACRRAIALLEALPRPPDVVVFMAADGSDVPEELPRLIEPFRSGRAELVLGSRAGAVTGPPATTRLALGLIGLIYRQRFADVASFRAIRFPALVALGLRDLGAGFEVEMQVRALTMGLHIIEVPVSRGERQGVEPPAARIGRAGRMVFQILRHATAR